MKTCPKCAEEIKDEAVICKHCKTDLQNPESKPREDGKNKSLAIVLALFLGGFGAHKFYLNKPGAGILYALFVWTFIPSILSIVDIIMYATTPDAKFHEKFAAKS